MYFDLSICINQNLSGKKVKMSKSSRMCTATKLWTSKISAWSSDNFALALMRVSDALQVPVECLWAMKINQITSICLCLARLHNTDKPQKKATASKNSRHLAVTKSQFPAGYVPYRCFSTRCHCKLEVCYAIVNWKRVRLLSPDHLWQCNTII